MEILKVPPICKLCGGTLILHKIQKLDGNMHYEDWQVKCNKCGCTHEFPADDWMGRVGLNESDVIHKVRKLHDPTYTGGDNWW